MNQRYRVGPLNSAARSFAEAGRARYYEIRIASTHSKFELDAFDSTSDQESVFSWKQARH